MRTIRHFVVLWLIAFVTIGVQAQEMTVAERNAAQGFNDTIDRLAPDFIEASLITADPGNQSLFSVFGHAAIRLKCPTYDLDYCFSYESENLSKDIGRFASGKMQMGMMAFPLKEYLPLDPRAISEYPMNLPPHAKVKLWEILDGHLQEEYCMQYDYLHRACAYMNLVMLDEMDAALDDIEIKYNAFPANLEKMTYGDLLCAESKEASWTRFWVSTICYGKETIDPNIPIKHKVMYPDLLVYTLQHATIDGVPVLSQQKIIHTTAAPMRDTRCKPSYVALLILLLALWSLFLKTEVIDYCILTIQTGFALFITYLVFFSKLPCTDWSFISLLYNPLPIILWKWRKYWSLPYAIILCIWGIAMMCWPHYIVDEGHLVFTYAFAIVLIKQWIQSHYYPSGSLRKDWHNPLLANIALWLAGGIEVRKLKKVSSDPQASSAATLRRILTYSQNTFYGQEHHFSSILEAKTDAELVARYQQHVPINSYESLQPYIERHKHGEKSVLFPDKPFMYAMTSGTTSAPKWIPISSMYLNEICGRMSRVWFYSYTRLRPWVFTGVNLSIVGKKIEAYAEDGTICGSVSSVTQRNSPSFLQYLHAVPCEINDISDYAAKYYTLMRLTIERNVTSIITPNPSTILELQHVVDSYLPDIIKDIEEGTLSRKFTIEQDIRNAIEAKLKPNPRRAKELQILQQQNQRILPKYYWPNLQIVNTWKCGNTEVYARKLDGFFPENTLHAEFGYFATECRFGLVLDETNNTVLFPHMHYYEFVKASELDKQPYVFYQLQELQEGEIYCPFVTTCSGLYRYNMNDIVKVEQKYEETPTIHMVQKTNGFVSITGEKLHETQFVEAVRAAEKKINVKTAFYVAFADVEESRYHFMFELMSPITQNKLQQIVNEVDKQLCKKNIEYNAKRQSHRLKDPIGHILPNDSFNKFKRINMEKGGLDGQFKINLIMQDDSKFQDFLKLM